MKETKQKIYKYPTGAEIPEGAVYLGTVTQTEIEEKCTSEDSTRYLDSKWNKCWLVWHYFLVKVE